MATDSNGLFSPGSWAETGRIAAILRKETVGGALLLLATVVALVWANTPSSDSYFALRDTEVGPAALHLNLTVGEWAADGLLAIFFFVAGLELKREFVAGDLRDPKRAVVPIAAAVGGMIVPAVLYLVIAGGTGPRGWAIPTATDIAFALAVLAVISTHLPAALRTFLLTLAVVDDLLAIIVIAMFYTSDMSPLYLAAGAAPARPVHPAGAARHQLVVAAAAAGRGDLGAGARIRRARHRRRGAAGIRGAGAHRSRRQTADEARSPDDPGLAEHLEHVWRPISSGVAVPIFALFSAGVLIGGWSGLQSALTDPIAIGIIAGLVVGKPIGILAATFLASRVTRQPLQRGLTWPDVTGIAILGGIGFTVSLLIGELAFGGGSGGRRSCQGGRPGRIRGGGGAGRDPAARRNRRYRALYDEENRDDDHDGIPDIYEQQAETGSRHRDRADPRRRRRGSPTGCSPTSTAFRSISTLARAQWAGYVERAAGCRLGDGAGAGGRRLPGLGVRRGHRR